MFLVYPFLSSKFCRCCFHLFVLFSFFPLLFFFLFVCLLVFSHCFLFVFVFSVHACVCVFIVDELDLIVYNIIVIIIF